MSAARLADAVWPEVDGGLLLVPLGSTEQHGPHLPFSTDTLVAAAVAGSDFVPGSSPRVTVAPALPYGASGEHAAFPGTLSIGSEALETVLVELGRSASLSFDRVLFVNGHGGNHEALTRAVGRLRDEGRDVRAFTPRLPGDAHAGHTETSVLLHLYPELVRTARAPGTTTALGVLLPVLRERGVRAVAPDGVLGDPTTATAAHGAQLLAAAVAQLAACIADWVEGPAAVPVPAP